MTEQQMVREFHDKFGVPTPDVPTVPPPHRAGLRIALIAEELEELRDAIVRSGPIDMVGVADALGDLLYVVHGAALEFGIDIRPVFREIHASNLRKEGGATRGDGKILKPAGWVGPDIAGELRKQGWQP